MSRPTLPARKPSAAEPAAPKPRPVVDDMAMLKVTTAMRRDLWRELQRYALDQDCTILVAMNRAVHAFLTAQAYTPRPLDE